MIDTLKNFLTSEDGAAVAEMTILMAAFAGMALAVTFMVGGGLEVLTLEMESVVTAQDAAAAW